MTATVSADLTQSIYYLVMLYPGRAMCVTSIIIVVVIIWLLKGWIASLHKDIKISKKIDKVKNDTEKILYILEQKHD